MKSYSRPVFFYETDKMSIVHNANYLRIFEEARLDHMRQSGMTYKELEDRGVLVPQIEAHVNYEQTLIYGDEFVVDIRLVEFNGVKFKYTYEIRKKDTNEITTTGYTCHCFLDEITRMPLSLKKKHPDVYEIMKNSMD